MSYYFISIGGSGAKVMESLTHLTASGLLPNNFREEKLFVMAIDPDIGNGNLKRSSAALIAYNEFQKADIGADTPLFKTETELARPFIWNPTEHDKKLDDIMSYQAYKGTPIGDLYEALYTKDERDTFLNEGFRGRPSIGAAVMAKKVGISEEKNGLSMADAPWDRFVNSVNLDVSSGKEAKIFLAGSVFGGTGASGMPTIARLLKHAFKSYVETNIDNRKVVLGGAMVLPYFSFPSNANADTGIFASSENFLTNTKAALKYYALKDVAYDAMYFIGDSELSSVKNFSVGASTQMNDAHIVDFYGAMAAIDFFSTDIRELKKYSFISRSNQERFMWSDLPLIKMRNGESVNVKERMADFTRFICFYLHMVKPVLKDLASGKLSAHRYPWYIDYLKDVNVSDTMVRSFEDYAESYIRYLWQLENWEDKGRSVDFVNKNAFHVSNADNNERITINPYEFPTIIREEAGEISINEVWTRLAERKVPEGKGFGKFLRALYEACKNDRGTL